MVFDKGFKFEQHELSFVCEWDDDDVVDIDGGGGGNVSFILFVLISFVKSQLDFLIE